MLVSESGVGAGIDSYYEYLLKAYILLGDETYLDRFNKVWDSNLNVGNTEINVLNDFKPKKELLSFIIRHLFLRWALMHRFVSVCHWNKIHWIIIHISGSVAPRVMEFGLGMYPDDI